MPVTPRCHMPIQTLLIERLWVPLNSYEAMIVHLLEYVYLKACVYELILLAHGYVCACFPLVCKCMFRRLCALMHSSVWPSLVLPAVLTLVCVDSKHSCRSQRPRSGRTQGSEGQWGRGERAFREHEGRKGKVEREKNSLHWTDTEK